MPDDDLLATQQKALFYILEFNKSHPNFPPWER